MAMLRPVSEMKDSGTRYLSIVPVDWPVRKLKRHLRREEPKNPGDVPVLSLYRDLGIVLKDSRDDNHNVTSENTSNYKYVQVGDFVVNKMKAWQGSVAVSDYEGIVSPAYYVYHFTDKSFNRRYFHYLLRGAYKEEFMSLSGGIRTGQWDLPSNVLYNCTSSRPSIESETKEDTIEPGTEKLTITADPRADGLVKARTGDTTDTTTYTNWYQTVYLPSEADGEGE